MGLAFAPGRSAVLATTGAVHHLSWNIQGLPLVAGVECISRARCNSKIRIVLWAFAGLLIAVGWWLYIITTAPTPITSTPLLWSIARLQLPDRAGWLFTFHFGVSVYLTFVANGPAKGGCVGNESKVNRNAEVKVKAGTMTRNAPEQRCRCNRSRCRCDDVKPPANRSGQSRKCPHTIRISLHLARLMHFTPATRADPGYSTRDGAPRHV